MIEKKTWAEFQSSGLLWFINRTLHLFGWAIVVTDNGTGEIVSGYPAHCKFRGFGTKEEEAGFRNLSSHIADNIDRIQADVPIDTNA